MILVQSSFYDKSEDNEKNKQKQNKTKTNKKKKNKTKKKKLISKISVDSHLTFFHINVSFIAFIEYCINLSLIDKTLNEKITLIWNDFSKFL